MDVPPPPQHSPEWSTLTTDDGRKYYYNSVSKHSQWNPPDSLAQPPSPAAKRRPQAATVSASSSRSTSPVGGGALKAKRSAKGIGHDKRVERLAQTGGDVMRAVFGGPAEEPRAVGGFLLEKKGRTMTITKQAFGAKDKCAEAYAARTMPNSDAWLSVLRSHRDQGDRFTDTAFLPSPAGGVDSPAIGLQSAYRQTTWQRLSSIYRQTRWIMVKLEDMDPRHSAAGQCCGYDPNLRAEPCLPDTVVDDDTTSEHVAFATEKARAIVDAMIAGDPAGWEGLIWSEGGAAFEQGLSQQIAQFPVKFKSIGKTHVKFNPGEPKEGYIIFGRFEVAVELHFGQDVHMFEREEGDVSAVEPGDINQGALGDCYYLCALSILSTHERLLFDALPDIPDNLRAAEALASSPQDEQTFNTEGVYAMRFWREGQWRIVVVDDYVPRHPQNPAMYLFASPCKSSAEIWCVIAEKAFAKLNGSYSVLDGGQAEEALEDLCGGVPFSFSIGSGERNTSGPYSPTVSTAKEDLWNSLIKWRGEESMVGVSWQNNGGTDKETKDGCFGNHAYGVLSVYEVQLAGGATERLVNIRNPHGHGGEYSGDWSDGDAAHWRLVSSQEKARLGMSDADDGAFFMSFNDCWNYWETLCVSRPLMPTPYIPSKWMFFNILSEWSGPSATGFPNIAACAQFQIIIEEKQEIVITISNPSNRVTGEASYPGLMLPVLKQDGYSKPFTAGQRAEGIYVGSTVDSGPVSAKSGCVCECIILPVLIAIEQHSP